MAKPATENHLLPYEEITNGNFNPPDPPGGSYVSTLSLDGWTLGGGGRGPVIPAEIINSAYAGMPTGHHYFDTEASPGATTISQVLRAGPNQPSHVEFDVYYQTFGGSAHTDLGDSIEVDVGGTGFGGQQYTFAYADLFDVGPSGGVPAPGTHAHVALDIPGAEDGNTEISFHEIGPGAATSHIGVGLTGVTAHAYDVYNGAQYDIDGILALYGPSTATPTNVATLQSDYLAITRTTLSLTEATTIVNLINAGTTTETAYVNSLLAQVANTTIPAVAVEGSMYGSVGSSAEITMLAGQFLPPQVANAVSHGYNPQVYASEALGLAFAFNNENGSTGFANNFGPSHAGTPNTVAGDAAFATSASMVIFGAASTATLVNAIQGYVANWKAFYAGNGIPGFAQPTADQVDLAARGAAWGDAVGLALANKLGFLPGQTTNFLQDAAQGIAVYSASLASQPAHKLFQGEVMGAPPPPAGGLLADATVSMIGVGLDTLSI